MSDILKSVLRLGTLFFFFFFFFFFLFLFILLVMFIFSTIIAYGG